MARTGHEWKDTPAAKMLSEALEKARIESKMSIRKIGEKLGYKQATVISHMANGREPIPIERAEEIATVLMMSPASFLKAVAEQRHPDVDWSLINRSEIERLDTLASELEGIIGAPLTCLNKQQQKVLREVASDPQPHLRWLSVIEASTIKNLYRSRSETQSDVSQDDIDEVLSKLEDRDE